MNDNKNIKNDTTIRRGKTNGYNSAKLKAKRVRKFEEACDRQASHDCLSIQDKIAKAKSRRGYSKKELARLTALLEASGVKVESKPIAPKVTAPVEATKKVTKKVAKKKAAK